MNDHVRRTVFIVMLSKHSELERTRILVLPSMTAKPDDACVLMATRHWASIGVWVVRFLPNVIAFNSSSGVEVLAWGRSTLPTRTKLHLSAATDSYTRAVQGIRSPLAARRIRGWLQMVTSPYSAGHCVEQEFIAGVHSGPFHPVLHARLTLGLLLFLTHLHRTLEGGNPHILWKGKIPSQ